MTSSPPSKIKIHPSLFIRGLYSLQGVSRTSSAPDITAYREDVSLLVGGKSDLLTRFRATKRFSHFVLRHAGDAFDHYDKSGKRVAPEAAPEYVVHRIAPDPIICHHERLVKQVTWLLERPTVCGRFEGHSGQSAADRGNFYTMADQLINLAKNDEEREGIYILTHHVPCQIALIAADMSKAAPRTEGVFLDYYTRLKNQWPLQEAHYKAELSRTFAGCRYVTLRGWLVQMRSLAGAPDSDADRFSMVLGSLHASARMALATLFVSLVYPRIKIVTGGVETLSDDAIRELASGVYRQVELLMSAPMSKS